MKQTILPILSLLLLLGLGAVSAQNQKQINEKKRTIERLEKQIAEQEKQIASLKKDRSSAEQRARQLARQIDTRNELLAESREQEQALLVEVASTDSLATELNVALIRSRERYAGMVREAWRNYRHNNYLTYIFSSESFADAARLIANLLEVASLRERQIRRIDSLERATEEQMALLATRKQALDSVQQRLTQQRKRLQSDAAEARTNIRQLSKKEQAALKKKVQQEQQLDAAIAELRKLTKGNKEGASFSAKTSNLRLPVVGGRVKKYHGNMAEISGPRGAKIISIYDGKVMDIKRNRITNKYDVYVAHGEYITSYANLSSVVVEKGASVKRNQELGVIGSSVDILTMESEYKLVFGIYPPDPKQKMLASDCFKSK
ncbi:MAG: peptidoglycan DD-metalloendopeptidase family protein [Alistipes sp.]|nr:peptidoglycan DD-metalloendopeptidase family protein [Alistipes sp.]